MKDKDRGIVTDYKTLKGNHNYMDMILKKK